MVNHGISLKTTSRFPHVPLQYGQHHPYRSRHAASRQALLAARSQPAPKAGKRSDSGVNKLTALVVLRMFYFGCRSFRAICASTSPLHELYHENPWMAPAGKGGEASSPQRGGRACDCGKKTEMAERSCNKLAEMSRKGGRSVDWPHGWATTQPPSQEPFVRNPYGWCMNRPCHKGISQVCLRIPLSFEQAWWEGSFDLDISRRSQGQIVLPDFVEHRLQGNPNGRLQMQTRG